MNGRLRSISMFRIWFGIAAIAIFATTASPQPEEYNHPELKWEVLDAEHFQVIYHQGAGRTAREILRIAGEIYEPITSLYEYEPDGKIRFIVRDHDDYSNGGAYYYDNKILIWAKPMDWTMRGTHNWLRNVVTHEFTHMIQLGAARKGPRWLPAFYAQWIDYEEEKRPDVLYGYPNVLASYPLPMTIVPPWFAEGTAQHQWAGLGYDHWDSHRDMILRMRMLEDNLLTYTEMGYFGKTSFDAEGVYDHGFMLVNYIAERWGEEKLRELTNSLRGAFALTFEPAFRKHLDMSGQELYHQWVEDAKNEYLLQTETIRNNLVGGEIVAEDGFANYNPAWSPDGKKLAYISNKSGDYFMHSSIFIYDLESEKSEQVGGMVQSNLSWSPEGRYIFYTKQFRPDKTGSHFDDIAAWDVEKEKEVRITEGRRASYVDMARDGKRLCYVVNADGTQNLWIADLKDKWREEKGEHRIINELALTHLNNGEQIYAPRWSPDGNKILFSESRDRDRDIMLLDLKSGEITKLVGGAADERDPCWIDDKSFYYASDRTGIFNLYQFGLFPSAEKGEPEAELIGMSRPISNVLGGAFTPSLSVEGKIAYADFRGTGYKLAILDSIKTVDDDLMTYIPDYEATLPEVGYTSEPAPEADSKGYKPTFDRTFIFPRIAFDFGTFKPGIYFYFQDILEQMSAFGGFAINGQGDYDLFALLDYKKLHPTLFVEAYNLVRHTEQSFEDPLVIVGETGEGANAVPIYDQYSIKYSFNLIEIDAGLRMKAFDFLNLRLAGIISRYRTTLRLDNGLAFGYNYFKGKAGELTATLDFRQPGRHEDINPTKGYYFRVKAAREYNDFIDGFEVNADKGTLQEVYTRYTYNRFSIIGDRHLKSPIKAGHGMTVTADVGFVDQNDVDDFFYLYAGGFDGMKGYSFYSLGGTRKAIVRGSYVLPLKRDIAKRFGFISFDKIFLQVYGDVGNAWVGDFESSDLKKDAGIALKTQFYSFTTFPTAMTFDAAYGFDEFQYVDDDGTVQDYGGEWRYYFTLLFNFNLRQGFSFNPVK